MESVFLQIWDVTTAMIVAILLMKRLVQHVAQVREDKIWKKCGNVIFRKRPGLGQSYKSVKRTGPILSLFYSINWTGLVPSLF